MTHHYQVFEHSAPGVVDGVIVGVKIVGMKSTHGYTYPIPVLRKAAHLYEGAPVFILHGDARERRQGHRQLRDYFGDLRQVRPAGDGVYGDLHIRESHPLKAGVLEHAGKNGFGLSHNVFVDMNDDETEVTQINRVESVDLCDNPATTTNLFESQEFDMSADTKAEIMGAIGGLAKSIQAIEVKVAAVTPPSTEEVEAAEAVLTAAGKHVTESKGSPPPRRLTAFENKPDDEQTEAVSVDSPDDFMTALRGYRITNKQENKT